MNRKIIQLLYKKEMLDVLRDKKTVLMMLIVPLVLYPLIFVLGLTMMANISTSMSTQTYRIAVQEDTDEELLRLFQKKRKDEYSFKIVTVSEPFVSLKNEEIDAYLSREDNEYRIWYLSSVTNSQYASSYMNNVLREYKEQLVKKELAAAGLNVEQTLSPITVAYQDMASSEETAGNLLGTVLPFMLVVSLLMGTMYPAIDTTAGERERGTLETLLTLPIKNSELIFSKFLTVATIGIASAVLNILSMGFVGVYMYRMTGRVSGRTGDIALSKFAPALLIGVLCVLAFAVFISAVSMCVTAFAKTYKEANNYITPLMLVVMFASFIGFIPNVELTRNMALIPVANICLLIRDLLAFKYSAGIIAIVLVSNVAYGLFAVMFLSRIYNSEAILFGDGSTGVQIFERRTNMKPGGVPTTGDAWFVIAITALLMIYLGGSLELSYGFYGILGTQLCILSVPVLIALYTKKDLKKTFSLRPCGARYYPAALLMVMGAILLGIVLYVIVSFILPESTETADASLEVLKGHGLPAALFVVAVTPAVCEEFLFRGYMFSAMKQRYTPWVAILITSATFGVFHMSPARFFGTAFLGACNCYLVYKSESIIPGMLMHVFNNALSVLVMYRPDLVTKVLPVLAKDTLSPADTCFCLVVGGLLVFVAVLLCREGTNQLIREKKE